MLVKSRLCQLLEIRYPIIQAPMAWIAGAELAAAVSNAGGLGTIGPNAGMEGASYDPRLVGECLRREIRRAKTLTKNPFAVNFPVGHQSKNICDRRVTVGIEEEVQIAIVSVGSPNEYTKQLKDSGMKVLHAVSSVDHAKRAEQAGVDGVVVEGYEGGGHSGFAQLPTSILVPQVADAISIPVIAGGGIVDARGFIAALSLGAEGVYMGTRFMATNECSAHGNVKKLLLPAGDKSTISYGKGAGRGTWRGLHNEFVNEYDKLEASGVSAEELLNFMARYTDGKGQTKSRITLALLEGDVVHGSIPCGAAVGLIRNIVSASELVQSLINGASEVLQRVQHASEVWQSKSDLY